MLLNSALSDGVRAYARTYGKLPSDAGELMESRLLFHGPRAVGQPVSTLVAWEGACAVAQGQLGLIVEEGQVRGSSGAVTGMPARTNLQMERSATLLKLVSSRATTPGLQPVDRADLLHEISHRVADNKYWSGNQFMNNSWTPNERRLHAFRLSVQSLLMHYRAAEGVWPASRESLLEKFELAPLEGTYAPLSVQGWGPWEAGLAVAVHPPEPLLLLTQKPPLPLAFTLMLRFSAAPADGALFSMEVEPRPQDHDQAAFTLLDVFRLTSDPVSRDGWALPESAVPVASTISGVIQPGDG